MSVMWTNNKNIIIIAFGEKNNKIAGLSGQFAMCANYLILEPPKKNNIFSIVDITGTIIKQ